MTRKKIPGWIRLPWTAYAIILIPVYVHTYGPKNFLWFSDLALFTSVIALWLRSPLLASMTLLSVGLPELFWNIGFFVRLATGHELFGLSAYMFDSRIPFYLRCMSLFHIILPMLLLWLAIRMGYDSRALIAQTLFGMVILLLTFLLTRPAENVNWVYGFGSAPQQWMPPLAFLGIMMIAYPSIIYLPSHLLMLKLSKHFTSPPSHSVASGSGSTR